MKVSRGLRKIHHLVDPHKPGRQIHWDFKFVSKFILKLEVFPDQARRCRKRERGEKNYNETKGFFHHFDFWKVSAGIEESLRTAYGSHRRSTE